jgi:hypothetical protein
MMIAMHILCCWLAVLCLLYGALSVDAKDHSSQLSQLVTEYKLGATFCKFLAWKMQIHHKSNCGEPQCHFPTWNVDRLNRKPLTDKVTPGVHERVVLSYSHNGFGNQLWEHNFAFMLAQSLNATLYVDVLAEELRPDGMMPQNSWQGYDT